VLNALKRQLIRLPFVRFAHHVAYYAWLDLQSGRMRGTFFVGLGNLLPDFYSCGFMRPFFWRLAGAHMEDCASSVIRDRVFVEHPKNLSVGKHFHVNRDSYLDASGALNIGDHVTISLGCRVLTISHRGARHEEDVIETTSLKDHCIVYAGATILPGTVVERYVLVAAGAVLKGETGPGGVYAGVPAVFKGYRKDVDPALYA